MYIKIIKKQVIIYYFNNRLRHIFGVYRCDNHKYRLRCRAFYRFKDKKLMDFVWNSYFYISIYHHNFCRNAESPITIMGNFI